MTTTTPARDRAHAVAMIVAPIALLASTIGYRVLGSEDGSAAIGILASALLVAATPGITRQLDARMPAVAAVLTVLFMFCFAIGGVSFNLEGIVVAHGAPSLDSLAVFPVIAVPGVLGPLTLAAIGVALFVARATPRFAAAALALGALLFPVSRIGDIAPLAIAVDLLLCAGLIPLALAQLRGLGAQQSRRNADSQ
ncbi:MAG: hypothetical protein ACRDRK_23190 [Pseudonocardia sp.]